MKILALCFFSDYWSQDHKVYLVDKKIGRDVMSLPDSIGKDYDIVISSPPCTQFTKANWHNWEKNPEIDISVVRKCLTISLESGKPWLLENVPGRIERLIPELTQYRVGTWRSRSTGKCHNLYSNMLVMLPFQRGKESINNYCKRRREMWQEDFVSDFNNNFLDVVCNNK